MKGVDKLIAVRPARDAAKEAGVTWFKGLNLMLKSWSQLLSCGTLEEFVELVLLLDHIVNYMLRSHLRQNCERFL